MDDYNGVFEPLTGLETGNKDKDDFQENNSSENKNESVGTYGVQGNQHSQVNTNQQAQQNGQMYNGGQFAQDQQMYNNGQMPQNQQMYQYRQIPQNQTMYQNQPAYTQPQWGQNPQVMQDQQMMHNMQMGQTKFCQQCGARIPAAAVVCTNCGCQTGQIQMSSPNIVIQNTNTNANVNANMNIGVGGRGRAKDKWVAFLLCLFGGYFGLHKFYEGKMGTGLLYLFTVGLFGFGWIIDCVSLLLKPNPYYV